MNPVNCAMDFLSSLAMVHPFSVVAHHLVVFAGQLVLANGGYTWGYLDAENIVVQGVWWFAKGCGVIRRTNVDETV